MLDLRIATPEQLVEIRNLVSLCVVQARNDKLPMTEFALELLSWAHALMRDSDIETEREVVLQTIKEEMDYNAIRKARDH
jgi:hypothetical protein